MHIDKELAMKALREAEKRFNEVIEEERDSAYFRFKGKAEILDVEFEESLWECEIKE